MSLRKRIARLIHHFYPSFLYSSKSFSQEGEDMVLKSFFEGKKGYKGFYVDIGAHHPYRFSNTAYFYKRGWNGINVEATPDAMGAFKRFRKRDININAAVGLSTEPLLFYQFNEPALNGFDKALSESRNTGKYKIIRTVEITPVKLSAILDQYLGNRKIDFLTLDVEGLDLDVLKSNNWDKYKPDYILIEDHVPLTNLADSEIYPYLNQLNYVFLARTRRTCVYKYNGE